MLKCEKICKEYMLDNQKIEALNNIDLNIKEGEFVSIIGKSGSGKSTLLNILGLLDSQTSGEYYINGKKASKSSKMRNREIGFIFQSFNLIPNLSALENVCLPLVYKGTGTRERRKIAENALKAVGLFDRRNHLPSQMSGGQMQRTAVARALVTNPKIILADEPTGNLDRENTIEILNILKNLSRQGKTVVVVTHDDKIAASADRIIKIDCGKIV